MGNIARIKQGLARGMGGVLEGILAAGIIYSKTLNGRSKNRDSPIRAEIAVFAVDITAGELYFH